MSPASGAVPASDLAVPGWRLAGAFENRFLPPAFITCILLAAQLSFGVLESYPRTVLAIVTAIAAELCMGRLTYGRWPHAASAYITGISVGILVRSPFFWPYALASLISIVSKYVVRWRDRTVVLGSGTMKKMKSRYNGPVIGATLANQGLPVTMLRRNDNRKNEPT